MIDSPIKPVCNDEEAVYKTRRQNADREKQQMFSAFQPWVAKQRLPTFFYTIYNFLNASA